jgi:hypothetical protein
VVERIWADDFEVKVRFYGDTALAQGNETWERRAEAPPKK